MATAKQIEANRRNAQKSTGPKTAEGKAASRSNATTHGLRASQLALPHEDPEEVQGFVDAIIGAIDPRDAVEAELAADIATLSWKLRRGERYEHACLAKRMMAMEGKYRASDEERMGWELEIAAHDDDAAGQRRRRYLGGIRSALSRARRELIQWRSIQAKAEPVEDAPTEVVAVVEAAVAPAKVVRVDPPCPMQTPVRKTLTAEIGFVRPDEGVGFLDFAVGRIGG